MSSSDSDNRYSLRITKDIEDIKSLKLNNFRVDTDINRIYFSLYRLKYYIQIVDSYPLLNFNTPTT